jgi:hypothetical protein
MNSLGLDKTEICKRVIKYTLEGLMVAFAALALPSKSLDPQDILGLALVAAATFAILDMYSNNAGIAARYGAGGVLGANLVGGLSIIR